MNHTFPTIESASPVFGLLRLFHVPHLQKWQARQFTFPKGVWISMPKLDQIPILSPTPVSVSE